MLILYFNLITFFFLKTISIFCLLLLYVWSKRGASNHELIQIINQKFTYKLLIARSNNNLTYFPVFWEVFDISVQSYFIKHSLPFAFFCLPVPSIFCLFVPLGFFFILSSQNFPTYVSKILSLNNFLKYIPRDRRGRWQTR